MELSNKNRMYSLKTSEGTKNFTVFANGTVIRQVVRSGQRITTKGLGNIRNNHYARLHPVNADISFTYDELFIIESALSKEYNSAFGNLLDDESFDYFNEVGKVFEKVSRFTKLC